jgi:murein DD-endopeptidase MepM/ murein hydrolase activator NlpD
LIALSLAMLLATPPAAAWPSARVTPARALPGDVVLVEVVDAVAQPSGALAGRPLHFWPAGEGRWLAAAPLPIETLPGPAVVALQVDGLTLLPALAIAPPSFASTTLKVPPRFLEPPASARKRIAADQAAIRQAYAQPFGPPRVSAPFAMPLEVEPSGRYGDQRVYNGKTEGVHYGLDLPSPAGTPVPAGADGQVVLARDCYMSGKTVLLDHGAGVFSASFHLSRIDVKVGQQVGRGQVVGLVGSTGRSTGPHLHWGIKVDGLWVDPRSALRLDLGGGEAERAAPPDAPAEDATPSPAPLLEPLPPPTGPPPPAADGAVAPPR